MKVDKKLISRLENLALLSFTDDEKQRLEEEFQKLIEMIDKLQEVDTEGVEPMLHINDHIQKLREDKAGDMLTRKEALKNANSATDEFFTVPRVIKKKG